MKKIAFLTIGLLLAAGPAMAAAGSTQEDIGNVIGDTNNNGYANINNGGVGLVGVGNSSGLINQNLNAGSGSNVGSSVDVVLSGGLYNGNGVTGIGSSNDGNSQLSSAAMSQLTADNSIAVGGATAYTAAATAGVNNIGVNGSTGIIAQNVNAGNASNVASTVGITIH